MTKNCGVRPMRDWARCAAAFAAAAFLLTLAPFACGQIQKQDQNQDDDHAYGYSYMHISVGTQAITNFVRDQKYAGWLTVEGVMINLRTPSAHSAKEAAPNPNDTLEQKRTREGWKYFEQVRPSSRIGPGKLNFGSGDDGGFGPMIDAQKRGTVIPSVELALYTIDGGRYIGRFKVTGVRVLSLEDVQASACPMYDVTLSFRSIRKE